jgi:hypothetical protein
LRRQKPTLPEDDVLEMCKKAFDSVLEGDEPWKAEYDLTAFVHNPALTKEEREELAKYTEDKIKAFRRNLLKVECMKKLMGEGKTLADIGHSVRNLGREREKITGAGMLHPFAAAAAINNQMQARQNNQMMNDLNRMGSGYGLSPQQLDRIAGLGGMK